MHGRGNGRSARHGRRVAYGPVAAATAVMIAAAALSAQQPAAPPATAPAPTPAAPAAASSAAPAANLNQLMRGLFFPHSNVVFATQRVDPAKIARISEPSTSSDPLTGVFGNWEAVEDSALVLTEAADLLMKPGRKCSNGREAPVDQPDWAKFVQDVRDAGVNAYKAAQTKDMDKMIDASEVLNNSCMGCHNRYRRFVRCQVPAR